MSRIANRRFAVLALLLAGLVGTGVWSLATVTDQLIDTNNYSVLTIDLQGSNDGTTFAQTLTQSFVLEKQVAHNVPIALKNTGNGQAAVTWTGTATGSSIITGGFYRVYQVANAAACPYSGGTFGTQLNNSSDTIGATSYSGTALTVAPGATLWLCQQVPGPAALTGTETAVQTLTFTATSTL